MSGPRCVAGHDYCVQHAALMSQAVSVGPSTSSRHTARIALAALALLLLSGAASGQRLAADEILVDTSGVSSSELQVVENGESRTVRGVESLTEPWRIVLYFDLLLLEPPVYRSAILDLEEQAKRLTQLGEVEIVLAGETVTVTLPPTRDPVTVGETLRWLMVRETSEGAQMALRGELVAEHLLDRDPVESGSALEAERTTELGVAMRAAVAAEAELLERQRSHLLSWLSDQDEPGPKALVLITSGFDEQPADYYEALVNSSQWRSAGIGLPRPEVVPTTDELAQALAIYNWTVIPYSPPNLGDGLLAEEAESDPDVEEGVEIEQSSQDGRLVDRTIVSVDPTKLLDRLRRRRQLGVAYAARLLSRLEPLQRFAEATGGQVIVDRQQLGSGLASLGERKKVRFDSNASRTDAPRSVEVRAGSRQLAARRWAGEWTPEVISAQRARRYLNDAVGEGDIYVSAAMAGLGRPETTAGDGTLVLEVDRESLSNDEAQPLRVTVAVAGGETEAPVFHRVVDTADAVESLNEAARFEVPVPLPADTEPIVVVFVEELDSGRWGGTFASFAVADADLGGSLDTGSLILPAPQVIHLMAPQEAMAMGRTRFDTVVSEGRVSRVRFLLDGRQVADVGAPPFSATLDLGKLPETHRIEAVAFGREGEELGRDRLTVNAGMGAFRVRIERPEPTDSSDDDRVVGPVEVEARVETPRGSDVTKVEFYWKDQLVSTRYAPPFVQRVNIPADDSSGFVRVLGHLEDGTTAEDVVFVNSQGSTERLDVDLVELYVVVTDRQGRPVFGLTRDQFQVLEEGVEQELADFGDASDRPLTVGLAIDSSASMFVKLPEVQDAAASFVRSLRSRRDRAFVVGFGSEPRLARDTTSDMPDVLDGLYRLRPDGQTAIWRAVVYSLVQLQGAGGKKALIVFSDGADEDPNFSYRTALEFARRVGAPIYFIVSNDEIYRTAGKSLSVRGFLGRLRKLTGEVGGRVFLTKVTDDLEQIYAEIEKELRSQYLVSYYARDLGGDRWRRVTVEVDEAGAVARTLAGYFR